MRTRPPPAARLFEPGAFSHRQLLHVTTHIGTVGFDDAGCGDPIVTSLLVSHVSVGHVNARIIGAPLAARYSHASKTQLHASKTRAMQNRESRIFVNDSRIVAPLRTLPHRCHLIICHENY